MSTSNGRNSKPAWAVTIVTWLVVQHTTVNLTFDYYTATLNNSISQCGRTRVCPNEVVLYECFVVGQSLVWTILDLQQQQHYDLKSDKNIVNNTGTVSVWLSNSTSGKLKSTMILKYTPTFGNATIQCNDKTSSYITAGNHMLATLPGNHFKVYMYMYKSTTILATVHTVESLHIQWPIFP